MTLVMKFGLLPPTLNADVVNEQLRLAHNYRNALIQVERERRRLTREAEAPYGVRELEGKLKELWFEKKKLKSKQDKESKQRVKDIDAKRKEIRQQIADIRTRPELVSRMVEINGKEKKPKPEGEKPKGKRGIDRTPNHGIIAQMVRASRKASGVFWGTYLLVERAAGQSFSKTGPLYDGEEDNDPKFLRWDGEGQVGLQIQRAKPLQIMGDDPRVQIAPVDMAALTSPKRSERRKAARTTLRMAVAGNARGKSTYVCAEWPMFLHRPIPEGSRITWVAVSRRKIGPREVWSCEITLEPPPAAHQRPTPDVAAVAVVLGWRKVDATTVRVAHWMGIDGSTGSLDLRDFGGLPRNRRDKWPADVDGGKGGILDGLRRVASLRSTRDTNFNKAKADLVLRLREFKTLPKWLRKSTQGKSKKVPTKAQALAHINQWRSPGRLACLALRWKNNRFDMDQAAYEALEDWRYHDYHLWQWERSQYVSAVRRRRELYRRFACQLVDRFGELVVDGTNFKDLKEKKQEQEEDRPKVTTFHLVACGELRDTLRECAEKNGRAYTQTEVKNTAIQCPECRAIDRAHRGDAHMFACSKCDFVRDIATVRLLNMFRQAGYDKQVDAIIRRGNQFADQVATELRDGRHDEQD